MDAMFKPREAKRPGLLILLHVITTGLGLPLMMAVYGLILFSWFYLNTPYINYTTSLLLMQWGAVICSVVILVFIVAKFNAFGVSLVFSAASMLLYFISIFDRGVVLGYTSVFTIDCLARKSQLTLEEYFICTQDGLHTTFGPAYAFIMWLVTILLTIQAILGFVTMFLDILWILISSRTGSKSTRIEL